MKCPVCTLELTPRQAPNGIQIDTCPHGCGGLWFDRKELEKLDEKSEIASATLLRVKKNADVVIDYSKERRCPTCHIALDRIAYDSTYQVEIDTCRDCDGTWLDLGELDSIHDDNERESVMEKTVQETELKSGKDSSGKLAAFVRLLFR